MPNKAPARPTPTPESKAIAAAIERSSISRAAIAERMDVSPGLVSQWASGRRPVAADRAPKLAAILGLDPKNISAAYRHVESEQGNVIPIRKAEQTMDTRETSLAIARLENDVHALNLALAALVTVMVSHRPAEAADVVAMILRRVPAKFRDKGLLGELLAALGKHS